MSERGAPQIAPLELPSATAFREHEWGILPCRCASGWAIEARLP